MSSIAKVSLVIFLILNLFSLSVVQAQSIGINFGADEPNGARSDVTGPAGVLGTSNWNNLDGAGGSSGSLVDDSGSAACRALDQDAGGAIRAPGRCDVYMGQGETAGKLAGQTYQEGRLYYLFLKSDAIVVE